MKRFLGMMMASILAMSGCLSVMSTEVKATDLVDNNNAVIIEVSEEEMNKQEKMQIENKNISYEGKSQDMRYWEYDWRPVDEPKYAVNIPVGYPSGQPAGGTVFYSENAGFFWKDGGSQITVNVSVGYGPFRVATTLGSKSPTGEFIGIEKAQKGVPVKLYISKDFKVIKYNVYRKPKGSNAPWEFYTTEVTNSVFRNRLSIKNV